jgi:hypothetical protein
MMLRTSAIDPPINIRSYEQAWDTKGLEKVTRGRGKKPLPLQGYQGKNLSPCKGEKGDKGLKKGYKKGRKRVKIGV